MDHSWRPPYLPPIPGNICPICSISHFPFCPPPPFIENPRFHQAHLQNDYYHQQPRFDHHHPFPNQLDHNYIYNYNYDPSDASVGRRPTWYGSNPNPSLGVSPYDPIGDPLMTNGNYNNYNRGGVGSSSYGYDNGGVKRMRVESIDNNRGPSGIVMADETIDTPRVSSNNERILKLIHDHGNAAPGGLSQVGDSLLGGACEVSDDVGLKRRRETSDFQSAGVGTFERKEPPFYGGRGPNLCASSREDHGVFGESNLPYGQGDELGQAQYGRIEKPMGQSLDYKRYGSQSVPMERSEHTWDHHKGAAPYHPIMQRSELKEELPLRQFVHDPTTETLHEHYHNSQHIAPSQAGMQKDPGYSHPDHNQLPPPGHSTQHSLQPNHNLVSSHLPRDIREPINVLPQDGVPGSLRETPYGWPESKGYFPPNSFGTNFGPREVPHAYNVQPPLPISPPPPLPIDPPRNHFFEPHASPLTKKPSLFPIAVSSSADMSSACPVVPENNSSAQAYHTSRAGYQAPALSSAEDFHTRQHSSENNARETFPLRPLSPQKPSVVDASHIFKQPHRESRPDHFVIILRGLPGSGKSYLAKMLRDLEVENGGEAPRIHSMDEYFMTEVEKAEDSELSKSSGFLRGKRPVMKTVMEYCYEPEMEEAYRASMLKAFKKTLDEGVYSFIIVDDRNLRVADFAQFWATAKRSGYEVYLLEAAYKDPAGCAARNVHNFTQDDIQKMAGLWEEAPSLYLKMDIKSLLHGDGFDESGIQEVDMDMEDGDAVDLSQGSDNKSPQNTIKDQVDDFTPQGSLKDVKRPVENHHTEEVNHLSKSKWSDDVDGSESHEAEGTKKKASALSGLIQAYSKEGKSVSWGDQGGNSGFSISATRKTNARSLIIGPGSGYNLKSNPLSEEDNLKPSQNAVEPKRQNVFQERIRAERESFKAVFDKRRQRIGGFNADDE